MQFFCQKVERPVSLNYGIWDVVDEFTYDHWDDALDSDGNPRYTGTRCKVEGEMVSASGTLSKGDLGILARILAIKVDGDAKGYVKEPEFVKFRGLRGNIILHEVNGGEFIPKKVA